MPASGDEATPSGARVFAWRISSAEFACRQGVPCDLAFAPDSQVLATAGGDGTVKLWQIRTGTVLAVLRHGPERANSLAFARDGRTLATAGFNKTVKLWNLTESK